MGIKGESLNIATVWECQKTLKLIMLEVLCTKGPQSLNIHVAKNPTEYAY